MLSLKKHQHHHLLYFFLHIWSMSLRRNTDRAVENNKRISVSLRYSNAIGLFVTSLSPEGVTHSLPAFKCKPDRMTFFVQNASPQSAVKCRPRRRSPWLLPWTAWANTKLQDLYLHRPLGLRVDIVKQGGMGGTQIKCWSSLKFKQHHEIYDLKFSWATVKWLQEQPEKLLASHVCLNFNITECCFEDVPFNWRKNENGWGVRTAPITIHWKHCFPLPPLLASK